MAAILLTYAAIQSFAIFGPFFPLDDLQELAVVNGMEHWWQIFGSDAFKLFRPTKNVVFAVFAILSTHSMILTRVIAVFIGCLCIFPVYALFRRIFNADRTSLLATAIWAFSPTLVSSIAWLSCVNIQVMCAFGALMIFLHDKAFETGELQWRFAVGSATCLFLACLSYECAVAVGLLVVAFDFYLRPKRFVSRRAWCAYLSYAAVTMAYIALRSSVGSASSLNGNFINATRMDMSLASAYFACLHFLVWLWPFGKMTPLGSYNPTEISSLLLAGCWIAVVGLATLAVIFRHRRPMFAFGIAFAFIAFLPVSNILGFGNGPYGDYYMGLPSIGLIVLMIDVCRLRFSPKWMLHYAGFSICSIFVASRCFAIPEAARWAWLWADGARAFESGIEAFPEVYGNRLMLAKVYYENGRVEQAMECCDWLENRLGLESDKMGLVYQLRALHAMNDKHDARAALHFLDSATKVDKIGNGGRSTRFLRGCVYEDLLDDLKSAEVEYRAAIAGKWSIDTPAAADRLARLLALRGDTDEAEALWVKALEYQPENAVIRHNLALLRRSMSKQ